MDLSSRQGERFRKLPLYSPYQIIYRAETETERQMQRERQRDTQRETQKETETKKRDRQTDRASRVQGGGGGDHNSIVLRNLGVCILYS